MKNPIKKVYDLEKRKGKEKNCHNASLLGSVIAFQPQEVALNLEYIKVTGKTLIIQNITYIYGFY